MANEKRVRIVLRKNELALVEWRENGSPLRAWVTPDMIVSEEEDRKEAIVENPRAGIPYGVEWSRMIELQVTPQVFEDNLRAQGIWTVADLRADPNGARAALQVTYGIDLAMLLNIARNL